MSVFIRHGDRNPVSALNFDPTIPSNGHLTHSGKERLSYVGRQMQTIVGQDDLFQFEAKEHTELPDYRFQWNSTASTRTRNSIEAYSYGFFPANWSIKVGNKDVFAQQLHPVYIYSPDSQTDNTFNMAFICPSSIDIINKYTQKDVYTEFKKKNQAYLDEALKLVKTSPENEWDLFTLLDTIQVVGEDEKRLPQGFSRELYTKIVNIRHELFHLSMPYADPEFQQINTSPIIDEVFFTNYASDVKAAKANSPFPKYRHYSCHDANLLLLAGVLGFSDLLKQQPGYSGMITVEMRINEVNTIDNPLVIFKHCWFPNKKEALELTEIVPPFCTQKCDLKTIQRHFAADHSVMADRAQWFTKTCGMVPSRPEQLDVLTYLTGGLIVLCIGIVAILRNGDLVAFPTETVYGLGGSALDESSIAKIYDAKGRPSDNPLIVHIASYDLIPQLVAETTSEEYKLTIKIAQLFWPGPLSLVFPKSDLIPKRVTGGLSTVVLRMPSDQIALQLLRAVNLPLAAPSANTSGKPSPTTSEHVLEDLKGRIPAILKGGCSSIGVESTVLDVFSHPPMILRPGGVTLEQLRPHLPDIILHPSLTAVQETQHHSLQSNIPQQVLEQISSLFLERKLHKPRQQNSFTLAPSPSLSKPPTPDLATPPPPTPGMKYTHYSPETPIVLCSGQGSTTSLGTVVKVLEEVTRIQNSSTTPGCVVVILTTSSPQEHPETLTIHHLPSSLHHFPFTHILSPQSTQPYIPDHEHHFSLICYLIGPTLSEVQHNIFSTFRACDGIFYADMAIAEAVPLENEGLAINNRMQKASRILCQPT
ncbi:putative Threonylcarbamoyl-AMP synthase [Blattamonas nauphoetae]|uniref:Threonylcarbamoyl-AMP synthase n=1 Tax=Blattamonas nauphoetae TaxID=2049346 RepID=A0ABQ9YAK0_9EUKA|nr:putative Threonylcarbamoyl-AMP synthase [Blattamonas nauphoetae]